ncbi:hypothetical protein SDC9_146462 [bioreactor metagenome]|uniref:DUF1850 domain-containing protein n=1 Tax=bioreactor metagenome TaxID=1076179 RepID=A0A645ED44_9ZZZZ|nr:DUF1850 domain-containing protein [Lutispora sp.]MEA4960267.1 DUF1850 domain-containing protein [Lutispora sp.]HCJ58624.1 hypothetical protein [Clostridiaceae bacterium]
MKAKKFVFIIAAAIVATVFFMPLFSMFTITDAETGKIVFNDRMIDNKEFYTSFIHSVNRMPVNEYYRIEDDHFIVYKTTFYAYGAGMPDFEDYKQKPVLVDGMVQIDNLDIKMDSFSIFVGTIANHSLTINNKTYYLSDFVEPGKSAIFKIKMVSLYALLRRLYHE